MGAAFSGNGPLPRPVMLGLAAAAVAGIAALLSSSHRKAIASPDSTKEAESVTVVEPDRTSNGEKVGDKPAVEKVPTSNSSASAAMNQSAPTYSSTEMLHIAHLAERTKSGDLGFRSQLCGESGELVEPAEPCGSLPTVYCDLDGTLSDFEAGVANHFKRPFGEIKKQQMWQGLERSRDFYARLPWCSEGRTLWEAIQVLAPVILSGVPERWGDAASAQKRRWVRRELGEQVPILTCLKDDKWRACRKGDVLIDDDSTHRSQWEEHGGIFVHHSGDASATLTLLKQLLFLPPSPKLKAISWVQAKWSRDWWWCKVVSQEDGFTEVEFMEPPYSGQQFKMAAQYLRWPRQRP